MLDDAKAFQVQNTFKDFYTATFILKSLRVPKKLYPKSFFFQLILCLFNTFQFKLWKGTVPLHWADSHLFLSREHTWIISLTAAFAAAVQGT